MLFHTKVDISKNKSLTPEGFLICRNVPIARTGDQTYYEGEVPITADSRGAIIITRDAEDVFNADAIASFEGKPITMHHPEDAVTPDNWSELSKGHAQNVRRGSGLEADSLYADLLIMEKSTIDSVMKGDIKEISCGYDADYVETAAGRGKQMNIRGNHIALVDRGRCGSLCAIHDAKTKDEKGGSMKEKLKAFFKSLTSDEAKDLGLVKDASLTVDQRLDKIEGSVAQLVKMFKDAGEEAEEEEAAAKKKKETEDAEEEEAAAKKKKEETEDAEEEEKDKPFGKSKDAAPILQEVLYRSSILAPDLSRPTMDSIKSMSKKTFDESICFLKRKSLDAAYKTEDGKDAISPFLMGKPADFMTMDCKSMDVAFIGASEVMKIGSKQNVQHKTSDIMRGAVTVSSINDANKKFWDARKGGK